MEEAVRIIIKCQSKWPYVSKFVNWPIQSGSEVSWLLESQSLSKRHENLKQVAKGMLYPSKYISWPIQCGKVLSWFS